MKKLILHFIAILILFFVQNTIAQISVAPQHMGGFKKFDKGFVEKVKNNKTVFYLSNTIDKKVYQDILSEVWTVTPFEIIHGDEFDRIEYIKNDYNIVELLIIRRTKQTKSGMVVPSVFTSIDFRRYNKEKVLKKFNKLNPDANQKKLKRKIEEILEDETQNIARFYLHPKSWYINEIIDGSGESIIEKGYSEEVFANYYAGLLKNYFQVINNRLKNDERMWMYQGISKEELANLSNETLYIPSYIGISFNSLSIKDKDENADFIKDVFSDYKYNYEIINTNELSNRIMSGEKFYYLRYTRSNNERFLQIVNSSNGEPIYREYKTGFSYNLKKRNIQAIEKAISREAK